MKMTQQPHSGAALHEDNSKTMLGFWIYLMTDCIIFATLFAVYAVLHNNTFGGAKSKELFSLTFVLQETLLLLTSSFTAGMAYISAHKNKAVNTLRWLGVTFILGATFLGMELNEFRTLIHDGHSWQASGFLSSYFTLVGTHGLHIVLGLLWLAVLMVRIYKRGLYQSNTQKLMLFSLFWHFLDVVWIFIFSIVYLMGSI